MPFALEVMQRLNDKCKEWRAAENIAYSVYGTPLRCRGQNSKVSSPSVLPSLPSSPSSRKI